MSKVIIREIIIAVLVSLVVVLLLSIALYNYIPTNKVIPEMVKYTPTDEIKQQSTSEVEKDTSEILMTYEITAKDLENYEKTNQYNPGRTNPFTVVSENNAENEEEQNSESKSSTNTNAKINNLNSENDTTKKETSTNESKDSGVKVTTDEEKNKQ